MTRINWDKAKRNDAAPMTDEEHYRKMKEANDLAANPGLAEYLKRQSMGTKGIRRKLKAQRDALTLATSKKKENYQ